MRAILPTLFILATLAWWATGTVRADEGLDDLASALTPFQDVAAAKAGGYAAQFGCIIHPTDGAMGIHYINGDMLGDPAIDALEPEAVIYEPQADGSFQAVGVEYVVLQDAWHAAGHEAPPSLLGQEFAPVTGFFDVPPFYALHIWLWRENPNGAFTAYNPAVACPAGTGVVPPNVAHDHPTTLPQTGGAPRLPGTWLLSVGALLLASAWAARQLRRS